MTIVYFFRQLKASGSGCTGDSSSGTQQWLTAGRQSQQEKHPLWSLCGFGTSSRQHTYWSWDGRWCVPQWFLFYRGNPIRHNPAGCPGTCGSPYFRKCKWCVLFWLCCRVPYNRRPTAPLPYVLWGRPICRGLSVLSHGSAQRISCPGSCLLGR